MKCLPYVSVIDGKLKTGQELYRRRITVVSNTTKNPYINVPITVNGKPQDKMNRYKVDERERELMNMAELEL